MDLPSAAMLERMQRGIADIRSKDMAGLARLGMRTLNESLEAREAADDDC